ncbi:hypothetical protein QJQ45_018900 [Haematococcus lacustris]|nr:hypothetical protein QJQ45_018900 [Haematococcus lacustris]
MTCVTIACSLWFPYPRRLGMQRNRQRKRNRNASDIKVDRELEAQPEPSQAQKNKTASGEARRDRHDKNTWHAKKAKRHTLMRGVCAAGLEAGAVVASEVVELRVVTQIEAWVEACSMRALLGGLLLGLAVRGWFTRVRVLPDGQEVFEEIPAEDAVIPNVADRNMYLQLVRGLPPPGRRSRPSAAVEDVLAFYPGLHARLIAVPRYEHDSNTVDDVGTKLETNFANSLTVLFLCRVEQGVSLARARVIAGSHEHQRRLWLPVDGSPAWTKRVVVNDAWLERGCNRGSLLRHAVDTSRQLEAANVSWQADWAVWQAAGGQRNTRPYRPPSPFALTPGCSCKAHHIKLDTQALFGLMRTAGMLPADITSLPKFRSGVAGPKDSEVISSVLRWLMLAAGGRSVERLPAIPRSCPAQCRAETRAGGAHRGSRYQRDVHPPQASRAARRAASHGQGGGRCQPAGAPGRRLAGLRPGKTNMATVAHEERYPSGTVKSVWQRSLTAGQYYRQSGITEHAKVSKVWTAGIKPQHDLLSQVTNYTASLQRYREYAATTLSTWPAMWAELSKRRWSNARFRLYGGKQRTVAKFWAEVSRPYTQPLTMCLSLCALAADCQGCNSAATGRPLALAYGAAGFSGSGSIGSKGVPVNQMQREACKQFPGRVVLVHEFRTSRVSSARTNVVQGQAESFRWLYPVRSMAKRSRIRGLMCSTSNVIKRRFYDRDVSAALNIARIAAGPGRPRELSSWLGRPAMPNPGRPGQEWVQVRDRGLLRKWQRRHQRQRQSRPRHWPRNSLFGTVFDPLHVILPPLGSTSHNGVASRRGGLVAGSISVPSSLCCHWTEQLANTSQVLGSCEDQHQTHSSPRVFQAGVQQGNQHLKTVSKR